MLQRRDAQLLRDLATTRSLAANMRGSVPPDAWKRLSHEQKAASRCGRAWRRERATRSRHTLASVPRSSRCPSQRCVAHLRDHHDLFRLGHQMVPPAPRGDRDLRDPVTRLERAFLDPLEQRRRHAARRQLRVRAIRPSLALALLPLVINFL